MASMRKKAITRWELPDGTRCKPNAPGGQKVRTETAKYYAFNVPGAPRPIPLARSRRVSETLFARLIAGGEADVAGIPQIGAVKTLTELVETWRQGMLDEGTTADHADKYSGRVLSILAAKGWTSPRQITAEGVVAELAARMRATDHIGPQTRNHYLTALKAFIRWLAGRGRRLVPADLLDGIAALPVEVDLRHARRSLTIEELGLLLADTADCGITIRWLSPGQRHCLYSLACATGFRANELASLTPAHFDLDAGVALMPARRGKNRRTTRQPLPADVVTLLAAYVAPLGPTDRLFPGRWWARSGEMLAADLARIGVPYVIDTPDGPLYADFHALKHTYVSLLEAAGVSLRDAMILARHSDPRLTLARYGRSQADALAREVQRLPVFGTAQTPDDAERVLLGWIVAGWCWLLSGCPVGCSPEYKSSETEQNAAE